MSRIYQSQLQRLTQKLSPQHIQMIKLLELPSVQLLQRVQQEIESNPILEDEYTSNGDDEKDDLDDGNTSMQEYLREDATPVYKYNTNNFSRDDKMMPVIVSGGRSLSDYLYEQLGYKNLTDKERQVAEYIIGSIDDDGYLRRELSAIVDDMAFTVGLDVELEELEKILAVVHELEPVGIGARNLKECLILQLDNREYKDKVADMALVVLRKYFDDFVKKHYDKLMNKLGLSHKEFKEVIEEIVSLSPKPANIYNEGINECAPYIIPDFTLDYQDEKFELKMTSNNIPEVKISKQYIDIIKASNEKRRRSDTEQSTLQFVKGKIESARLFISAIQQRYETLMLTMTEILEFQDEYFKDGDKSKLKPMILKDIAERAELDVSTISRVVNSKYIQTHFGILPLKQLFSEAMHTQNGDEVSSHEIKNILMECVKSENKQKPLTDEMLMNILNDKDYCIARRTVAKYREMLGIPVARLRREL